MPLDTQREALMAQIETDLLEIDGRAPYANRVELVTRSFENVEEANRYPAIVILEETENQERTASNYLLFLLARVTLLVYIKRDYAVSASTQLNYWLSDIKYAMLSDTKFTHGGQCHRTVYTGFDPIPLDGNEIIGAVIDFDLHYSHTWNAP